MGSAERIGSKEISSFAEKAAYIEAKIGKLEGRSLKYRISNAESEKISKHCINLIRSFHKMDEANQKEVAHLLQRVLQQVTSKISASAKLNTMIPKTEIQIAKLTRHERAVTQESVKKAQLLNVQIRDFSIYRDQKKVILSNTKQLIAQFSQDKIEQHIEKKMGLPLDQVKTKYGVISKIDARTNKMLSDLKKESDPDIQAAIRERVGALQRAREKIIEEISSKMEKATMLYGASQEIGEKIKQTEEKIRDFDGELKTMKETGNTARLEQLQNTLNINVNYLSDLSLGLLDLIKGELNFPKAPEQATSPSAPKEPKYPLPPNPKKMSKKEYQLQIEETYPGKIMELKQKYMDDLAKHIQENKAREKAFHDEMTAYKTEYPAVGALSSIKNSLNAASGKAPELNNIAEPLFILFQAFDAL